MKEKSALFEINTNGWNRDVEPYPNLQIIEKLRSHIGIITIGSDSHKPEMVSDKIIQGFELARQFDFKVALFSQRKIEKLITP